ncbi:MAG TPA: nucleoside deaminase [Phycisphaerales bacterium]|nr:nucleoside deaminase [Phycisphaerales bacterium]
MHDSNHFMGLARDAARAGIAAGQSPFGAVIVRAGQVIATGYNLVRASTDPSAHAEVVCIREAGESLGSIDFAGCEMYTTCEPCPMCAAAIHWANLDAVHFGARISDAERAGFRELKIPIEDLYARGGSRVRVHADVMRSECAALFDEWLRAGGRPY